MNHAKLLILFLIVLLASACGVAERAASNDAKSSKAITVQNTHSQRLNASKRTMSSIGIHAWHVLTENDTSSVVLEGVDKRGAVKFATSLKFEVSSSGDSAKVLVNSYRGAPGR